MVGTLGCGCLITKDHLVNYHGGMNNMIKSSIPLLCFACGHKPGQHQSPEQTMKTGKWNHNLFNTFPILIRNFNSSYIFVFAYFYYMEVQNPLANENSTSIDNTSSQDASLIGK